MIGQYTEIGEALRKNEHLWIAHMMARHSSLIVEYLCCVGVNPFEPHLTTFFPELSVSTCPRA